MRSQGFLRTLEVQFNRFVPSWVFRYSKGDVYDLSIEKLASMGETLKDDDSLIAKCLEPDADPQARLQLREFTWNTVPAETTLQDIGYAIYDANEPGKLLAGVWVARDSFLENNLGFEVKFSDQQGWLYCAFVHPDARGRGVYKRLVSFAAADIAARNVTQLLAVIQPWNRISRIMHEKYSDRIMGSLSAFRIGKFIWISHQGNVSVDKRFVSDPKNPASISISARQESSKSATTASVGSFFQRKANSSS